MDNNQEPNNLQQPLIGTNLDSSPSEQITEPKNPKQGITKKTLVLSTILAVLITASITSVAWFLITNNNKPSTTSTSSADCPTEPNKQDPTTSNTATPTTTTEIEITDAAVKTELDKKLSMIHLVDPNDIKSSLAQNGVIYQVFMDGLYENDQSDKYRLWISLWLNKDKASTTQDGRQTIKASDVESTFAYLYGTTPTHQSVEPWQYDSSNGVYVGYWGLGGVVPSGIIARKTSYTTEGDHAYVYADVLTHEEVIGGNTIKYYKGYVPSAALQNTTPALETDGKEQTVTEGIWEQAGQEYRFVFTKSSDGSYYFDSVEKL